VFVVGKIIKNSYDLSNLINNNIERENIKIVMVNGCFDLFHIGHLNLLKFAKNQGNILIVALNSDYSISKLKGLLRPIISQEDRSEIIASLTCVDYIVLFDEENPSKLIDIIKPDIIVKEEEYKNKKISEIKTIKKHVIDLIFYQKENNISTTVIIEKILASRNHI